MPLLSRHSNITHTHIFSSLSKNSIGQNIANICHSKGFVFIHWFNETARMAHKLALERYFSQASHCRKDQQDSHDDCDTINKWSVSFMVNFFCLACGRKLVSSITVGACINIIKVCKTKLFAFINQGERGLGRDKMATFLHLWQFGRNTREQCHTIYPEHKEKKIVCMVFMHTGNNAINANKNTKF